MRPGTKGLLWFFPLSVPGLALATTLTLHPAQEAFLGGETVRVVVTEPQLAGAEEFELLLRTKNLKIELVRLTPSFFQKSGGVVSVSLPHLPWAEARLELRAGSGGRERLAGQSHPFVIVPNPFRSLQRLAMRQGEWWPDETFHRGELGASGVTAFQEARVWPGSVAFLLPKESKPALLPFEFSKKASTKLYLLATASGVVPRWRPTINFPKRE
ncbi:MAG: hypothetical protein ACP5NF_01465 [Thermoanaerobaculum sp.]